MKTTFGLLLFVGACAVALWATGVVPWNAAQNSTVQAKRVEPRPIEVVRGIGYVEPASEIRRMVFKVDGVVEKVSVDVGQRVHLGDVLVTLANADEQAALAESEQQLALAQAERDQVLAGIHADQISAAEKRVALLEEQLNFANKRFKRVQELVSKNATTRDEDDKATTDVQQAEDALAEANAELDHLRHHVRDEDRKVAEAKVELAKSRVEVAKRRLENTVMLAPRNGKVLEILKREGEGARVLDPDPVLVFGDDAQLRVRAEIDERWVHHLKEGLPAEVYARGLGDKRYRGRISTVKGLMGPKTVFSREAAERRDLDVLQVFIDMEPDFKAPLGLQVDVDVKLTSSK